MRDSRSHNKQISDIFSERGVTVPTWPQVADKKKKNNIHFEKYRLEECAIYGILIFFQGIW